MNRHAFVCLLAALLLTLNASAQPTAFTYQGHLTENGAPVSGSNDLRFALFDAPTAGGQISTNLTLEDVLLTNGLFTVVLDWGAGVFDGSERWLELRVRAGNASGPYTTLAPRQRLTATPYAQRATTATMLSGSLAASQLTGLLSDARLSTNVSLLGNNIDTTEIVNGTIANVDINAAANIADTKLATINAPGKVANAATTATASNTPNAIVARDASGNFSAGTIVGSFTGNGAGLTNVSAATLVGNVPDARLSANVSLLGNNIDTTEIVNGTIMNVDINAAAAIADTKLATIDTAGKVANSATTATSASTPNAIVARDASGNFSAETITGNFVGSGAGLTNVSLLDASPAWAITLTTNAGTFGFTLTSAPLVGEFPRGVVSVDFNGDGKPDLASANSVPNTVSVLTNNGSGGFMLSATLPVGSTPRSLVTADVNADGRPDLVTANTDGNSLSVLTNGGNGSFALASSQIVSTFPTCVRAADVNGDGSSDLLVSYTTQTTLTILTNNGTGGFTAMAPQSVGRTTTAMAVAELNGDGTIDLLCVASTTPGTMTVLLGAGNGTFVVHATNAVGNGPNSPFCLIASDVTGDGKPDAVCANASDDTLTVLTNNGAGTFGLRATVSTGDSPLGVHAADVNGDGRVDLLTANSQANTVSVLTNSGSGTFALAVSPVAGLAPVSLTSADVNSDGAMDLCVANQSDDTISILQNSLPTLTTSASFQGNFNGPTLTVNGPLTAAGLLALGRSTFSAAAGSTLSPTTSHVQIFPNVLAAVSLNATTAIANGTAIGQVLILKGAGLFTVMVPDNANTQLQADRALGSGDTLFLLWDGSEWNEVSYSNN